MEDATEVAEIVIVLHGSPMETGLGRDVRPVWPHTVQEEKCRVHAEQFQDAEFPSKGSGPPLALMNTFAWRHPVVTVLCLLAALTFFAKEENH